MLRPNGNRTGFHPSRIKKKITSSPDSLPFRELWVVAKALHVSPFSETISNLSQAEFMWVLMNHFKDEEEAWKKQEILCAFINPQAADTLFTKKNVEITESTKDVMFDQISQDLGHKYTPEELEAIMADPKHYSELDRIEKV